LETAGGQGILYKERRGSNIRDRRRTKEVLGTERGHTMLRRSEATDYRNMRAGNIRNRTGIQGVLGIEGGHAWEDKEY
jgi:hypothetical protein